jgi:predicted nucleic acid-binding protein
MLVVDASVVVPACGGRNGFAEFGRQELIAPPLMWSEARSVLHLAQWHGQIDHEDASRARRRLEDCPVKLRNPKRIGKSAWRLADELGWARTYDAEYVALAELMNCRLVTLDSRLRKGTERLGYVISPAEL